MKPKFSDLTLEQQKDFGNGCTLVPDFIFTASCQQHDFGYCRGGGIKDKLKADRDMFAHMWADSSKLWHYTVSVIYYLGLTFIPWTWMFFHYGKYRTLDEILLEDYMSKGL